VRRAVLPLVASSAREERDVRLSDGHAAPAPGHAGAHPGEHVLSGLRARAELNRLGLGAGEGEVGQPVHRLTALAARLLGAARAQVSLLGSEQWVAATAGFRVPDSQRRSPLSESLCTMTAASGAAQLVDDALQDARVRDLPPVQRGLVRRYAGAPLVSEAGVVIGALCVFDATPTPWPEDAADILTDLAAAVMTEIQLRQANRELTTVAEQLRRLQDVTARLATAVSVQDVAAVLVERGIPLVAEHGVVAVRQREDGLLRTWPTAGIPAELAAQLRSIPTTAPTPVSRAVRTGRPVVLQSFVEIEVQFPATVASHIATGTRCVLAVPARAGQATIGALAFGFADEHAVDDDTLHYAQALADLAGQALDRARLYEVEHSAAHQLQQALLPARPPVLDGIRTAAGYRPADSLHEIGGDWYDVFALPGGRAGLVVGDVVGHDLDAAATMGRLQAATRILAHDSAGPAETLRRLDDACPSIPGAHCSTVGVADYDPGTGVLRYACAGHLPPLLVTGSTVRYLTDGRSVPLGVSVPAGTRPRRGAAEVAVPAGSLLVWYTDGLVERRGEDLGIGLRRLADLVRDLPGTDLENRCAAIMDSMVGGARLHDDVALLCVRFG
jgi:serine phosphatase RsbU (regulator of sigma subunit)